MSTLLDNSARPLWVWILVIVIGSLFILGVTAWLVRCWIVRRRNRADVEFLSDQMPEKKLTLRRGRIVPATSYLSLTGSTFGMNSYVADEGVQSPSVRSKSPFEWWSNLKGRSSRLSYVSNISSAQYPSRAGSLYLRPEMSTSKLSLTSKDGSLHATVTEIKVAKPQTTLLVPSFKRASRNFEPVNFSRSFIPQSQRSLAAHRNQTLSRIEEMTPRQSFFSTVSFRNRIDSYSTSELGQAVDHPDSGRTSHSSHLKGSTPLTHSRKTSRNSAGDLMSQLHAEHDYANTHQHQHQPPINSLSPYMTATPTTPSFPEPIADPTSSPVYRQSLWGSSMKQFPCLEQHQTLQHGHDHDQHVIDPTISQPSSVELVDQSSHQSQPYPRIHIQHPSTDLDHHQLYEYVPEQDIPTMSQQVVQPPPEPQPQPQPQIPSGPLRTRSKKGNVLRKKSLERTRVLAAFG